jgi:hypothetical protein
LEQIAFDFSLVSISQSICQSPGNHANERIYPTNH